MREIQKSLMARNTDKSLIWREIFTPGARLLRMVYLLLSSVYSTGRGALICRVNLLRISFDRKSLQ